MISIRRKKVYKSKKYRNPYFRRNVKNISFNISWNWRSKLFLFIGFVFFIIILYVIFYSPLLKINHININGNIRITKNDLLDTAWQKVRTKKLFILPQDNLIFLDKNDLANIFNDKFSFENISIDKQFPHTINIEVQEKSYAFVWVENDIYYYSDIEGYIIKEISPIDIKEKKYPIIDNKLSNKIVDKKIELDQAIFNFVINLYNSILTKSDEYKIDKFILDDNESTVKLELLDGPEIIFNTSNDLDAQLNKLTIIKEEKLKSDFNSKSYIDLRFGDRVYYR